MHWTKLKRSAPFYLECEFYIQHHSRAKALTAIQEKGLKKKNIRSTAYCSKLLSPKRALVDATISKKEPEIDCQQRYYLSGKRPTRRSGTPVPVNPVSDHALPRRHASRRDPSAFPRLLLPRIEGKNFSAHSLGMFRRSFDLNSGSTDDRSAD